MTQESWAGVRDRVIAAESAHRQNRGRTSTRPILDPPMTADELAEFEARHGAALSQRAALRAAGHEPPSTARSISTSTARSSVTTAWSGGAASG